MAIYSLANRTGIGTTGAANTEVRTTSTDRASVLEIGITIAAATASIYGIGRPAAIGVNPTSPVTVLAEDPASPAGTVVTAIAWTTTAPTVPTNFFRRISFPATIGAGFCFTFPRGLIIAVSNSIVCWNLGTNSVIDIWVVVDE
jgi:hypothetical protein